MKHINFMGQRRLAIIMSAVLLLISLGSLMVNQLEWGLDFTGGTLVEVEYGDSADLDAIRSTLETRGYPGAQVVSFGTDRDVLIRLPADLDADGSDVLQVLRSSTSDSVELRRTEFVGPQVGDELREQGGLAMLLALGLVVAVAYGTDRWAARRRRRREFLRRQRQGATPDRHGGREG